MAFIGRMASPSPLSIEEVEALCAERGQTLTSPRRRVMQLLLDAAVPVKAYDLLHRFRDGGKAAQPPTVYRALDFLEQLGVVHRVLSRSAFVACRLRAAPHTPGFLLCETCDGAEEVSLDYAAINEAVAGGLAFTPTSAVFELSGHCASCRAH